MRGQGDDRDQGDLIEEVSDEETHGEWGGGKGRMRRRRQQAEGGRMEEKQEDAEGGDRENRRQEGEDDAAG
eukprot:8335926-Pyramimonas_sp.AAC.1